jgi:hypothetical protein
MLKHEPCPLGATRHNGTEADVVRRMFINQYPRAERTIVALLRRRLDQVTRSSEWYESIRERGATIKFRYARRDK